MSSRFKTKYNIREDWIQKAGKEKPQNAEEACLSNMYNFYNLVLKRKLNLKKCSNKWIDIPQQEQMSGMAGEIGAVGGSISHQENAK